MQLNEAVSARLSELLKETCKEKSIANLSRKLKEMLKNEYSKADQQKKLA